ncbi:N-acetylglucosamine kinase [Microbacterium sp. SA39]|uniref:N-acetylglucosamine kinase n=1 Tax=Microbacterium sp. SA39 TaxID=1263625 RepID=UPI0005F9B12F|nr:BadF/BadG/BcrA/BcrD ATPase family protein [Microbacterium sp. SA39]KJQ53465.1 Glucosamine kinase GspK [Microbacterium sp. SA39]
MPVSPAAIAVDLGKSRCRVVVDTGARTSREGVGAPGLAAAGGVAAALESIRPLLVDVGISSIDAIGVGAAGAWAAPDAASELSRRLADEFGVATMVASDVVTAHAGALGGGMGVLLIAGTGAAALGIDAQGARLIDGWGPELGDFGSGSWLGREALRAVLRAANGLAPTTALAEVLAKRVGSASDIPAWLAASGPLPARLAALAPLVLDAAEEGDPVSRQIIDEGIRLLTRSAVAASNLSAEVVLHGGLTEHSWFRTVLTSSLHRAERRAGVAGGDALDGALLLARRVDLPHERFVHRAA